MNKRLVKLIAMSALTLAIALGLLRGGPSPALAVICPDTVSGTSGVCYWTGQIECDEVVGCCCVYLPRKGSGTCTRVCD